MRIAALLLCVAALASCKPVSPGRQTSRVLLWDVRGRCVAIEGYVSAGRVWMTVLEDQAMCDREAERGW